MRFGSLLVLLVGLALSACSTGGDCPCLLCEPGAAVTLTVTDGSTGAPITTFLVDVAVNDVPLGEPPACSEEQRAGNEFCSFGDDTGLYHLVVAAPGYETREALVRQGEPGGGGLCCRNVCLTAQSITVALDPLESP